MTFLTELERLKGAVDTEPDAIKRFAYGQQLDALLRNHADALAELVRAAEQISRMKRYSCNPKMIISSAVKDEHWLALDSALAALDMEQK